MPITPDWRAQFTDWRAAFADAAALDEDADSKAKAARGRQLEKIFNSMLEEAGLNPRVSYRPKGEEVDGSFFISGRTMLLEVKWRSDPQPASTLYQFMGKVNGKLVGTIGLFVSMSGFTSDAVDALVAGKELTMILMDGTDVQAVVDGDFGIEDAIHRKLRAAAESGTPFFPLTESGIAQRVAAGNKQDLILVEGRFDERIITTLIEAWGTRADRQSVVPVGGPSNFAPSAEALLSQFDEAPHLIVIADGDGRPAATKKRISNDLARRLPDIRPKFLIVDPTLESALGLSELEEFPMSQRRPRTLDDHLLLERVTASIFRPIEQPKDVRQLFRVLGINVPDFR